MSERGNFDCEALELGLPSERSSIDGKRSAMMCGFRQSLGDISSLDMKATELMYNLLFCRMSIHLPRCPNRSVV